MSTPDNIIIDDSDPSIVYESGKWTTDTSPINYTASGRPFNNTAHITYEQASFTITFQGDGIELWGLASSPSVWSGSSGGEAIDSGSTSFGGAPEPGQQPMFRFSVGYDPISWGLSGPNTLKMTVNGSQDNPVAFDFARITPSGSGNSQVGILEYTVSDAFHYGSVPKGWTNDDSLSTSTPDAPYVFNFTGTSIAGLGGNGVNDSHIQAIASYSIDGNTPINFTVNNLATSVLDTVTEQVLFQTNQYPLGNHSLQLVYHGDNTTTPLSLASLLVTSTDTSLSVDPAPPSQPSMSASSTSSTHSPTAIKGPPATHAKNHKTTIAIIVSVTIIVIVILFFVAGFLLYRRRQRRFESKRYSSFSLDPGPVAMAIVPFTDNSFSSQSDMPGGSFEVEKTMQAFNHAGGRLMDDVPSMPQRESLAPPSDGINHHIVTRVHEDSGVLPRQPPPGQIMVVDLPPSYTSLKAESRTRADYRAVARRSLK